MRGILLLVLGFVLLVNCKNDKVLKEVAETQEQIDARTIYESDIVALRYTDFGLSSDSERATNDWQKFQELQNETNDLKKGSLDFFSQDRLLLTTFLAELQTEMPEELKTNEIMARLTALNTKAQKLHSLLTLDNIDKSERLQAIKEYLVTVSNLNLQMNKKFEFDKNNIVKPE